MFCYRAAYFLASLPLFFILSAWRGPTPGGGGQFFVAGVQVFIGYVILAIIFSVIYYLNNKEKFQVPEEEDEEYLVDILKLFKIFWVFPMVFFIFILTALLFLEFMF